MLVHGFETDGIELSFEAKMPDAALELKYFQFGVGQHGGKEMGGLRGQGLRAYPKRQQFQVKWAKAKCNMAR